MKDKLSVLKQKTLLLVEDDDTLLEDLTITLNNFFGTVLIAENGAKGMEIFNNEKVDVIMTDYVMPVMNGYELSRNIRKYNQDIPIIMMSNYTDKDKLLNSIPLNLVDYIVKPVNYEKLLEILNKIILKIDNVIETLEYLGSKTYYDFNSKVIIFDEKSINLTHNEVLLIELFLNNKNKTISIEKIQYVLNIEDYDVLPAIRNAIYRLRKKIGKNIIKSHANIGYSLIIS